MLVGVHYCYTPSKWYSRFRVFDIRLVCVSNLEFCGLHSGCLCVISTDVLGGEGAASEVVVWSSVMAWRLWCWRSANSDGGPRRCCSVDACAKLADGI